MRLDGQALAITLNRPGYFDGVRIRSDHSLRRVHKVRLSCAGTVFACLSGIDAVAFTIALHQDVHLWFVRKGQFIELGRSLDDQRLNGALLLEIEPALIDPKPQELKIVERRIEVDEFGTAHRAYMLR